jgi:site-specific recombinase XerD
MPDIKDLDLESVASNTGVMKSAGGAVISPSDDPIRFRLGYTYAFVDSLFPPERTEKIRQYLAEWAEHLASREKSDNTILTYLTHISYLLRFLADKPALSITSGDAERFMAGVSRELSPVARNTILYSARSFYKFLVKFEYEAKNPFELVEGVRQKIHKPRPLSEAEYKHIYDTMARMRTDIDIVDKRFKRFIEPHELLPFLFLMNTGLRSMELAGIRVNHFKPCDDGRLEVTVTGKGNKERDALIVNVHNMWSYVQQLFGFKEPRIEDFFWIHLDLGRAKKNSLVFEGITRNVLYDLLKQLNTLPRVVDKQEETDITLHQFRHTYATYLLDSGFTLEEIMTLLGHKSFNTTLIYAAVTKTKMANSYLEMLKKQHEERETSLE